MRDWFGAERGGRRRRSARMTERDTPQDFKRTISLPRPTFNRVGTILSAGIFVVIGEVIGLTLAPLVFRDR